MTMTKDLGYLYGMEEYGIAHVMYHQELLERSSIGIANKVNLGVYD